eukprot:753239-Hanusia_phi.AAC.2
MKRSSLWGSKFRARVMDGCQRESLTSCIQSPGTACWGSCERKGKDERCEEEGSHVSPASSLFQECQQLTTVTFPTGGGGPYNHAVFEYLLECRESVGEEWNMGVMCYLPEVQGENLQSYCCCVDERLVMRDESVEAAIYRLLREMRTKTRILEFMRAEAFIIVDYKTEFRTTNHELRWVDTKEILEGWLVVRFLLPAPCTLHPAPCALLPAPCSLPYDRLLLLRLSPDSAHSLIAMRQATGGRMSLSSDNLDASFMLKGSFLAIPCSEFVDSEKTKLECMRTSLMCCLEMMTAEMRAGIARELANASSGKLSRDIRSEEWRQQSV